MPNFVSLHVSYKRLKYAFITAKLQIRYWSLVLYATYILQFTFHIAKLSFIQAVPASVF